MSEYQETMDLVNKHVTCLKVRLSIWHGRKQLPDADVLMGGEEIDATQVTTPQGRLLPPDWAKKFAEITNSRQELLNQHSIPHMAPGFVSVRTSQVPAVVEQLHNIRERLFRYRDELIADWQSVLTWNRDQWKTQYEDRFVDGKLIRGVRNLLPAVGELPKKFNLTWVPLQVTPGVLDLSGAVEEQLESLRKTTNAMLADEVRSYVDNLLTGPRELLRTSVVTLATSLQSMTKVTPDTFNKVRAAVTLLREFHDLPTLQDHVLHDRIAAMEHQLSQLTPRIGADGRALMSLDIAQALPEITQTLEQIAQQCADDATRERLREQFFAKHGRLPRQIG